MKREIKFRAWNKLKRRWEEKLCLYLDDSKIGDVSECFHNEDDAEAYEIEQYTGLKDKNGTDIYEGDILMPAEGAEVWFDQKNGVTVKDVREPFGNAHLFEVVSNIHEKPKKSAPIAFGVGDHPDYKYDDSV